MCVYIILILPSRVLSKKALIETAYIFNRELGKNRLPQNCVSLPPFSQMPLFYLNDTRVGIYTIYYTHTRSFSRALHIKFLLGFGEFTAADAHLYLITCNILRGRS